MSLVGKYAVVSGEEYYRKVRIVEQIGDEFYLVLTLGDELGPPTSAVFNIHQIVTELLHDGSLHQHWFLFQDEQEANTWIDWMNTPSETDDTPKLKVVPFKAPQGNVSGETV